MNEFYVAIAVLSLGLVLVILASRRQHSIPHRAPETLPTLVVRKPVRDPSGLRSGLLAGLQAVPPPTSNRALGGAMRTVHVGPVAQPSMTRTSAGKEMQAGTSAQSETRRRSPLLAERNRIFSSEAPPQLLQSASGARAGQSDVFEVARTGGGAPQASDAPAQKGIVLDAQPRAAEALGGRQSDEHSPLSVQHLRQTQTQATEAIFARVESDAVANEVAVEAPLPPQTEESAQPPRFALRFAEASRDTHEASQRLTDGADAAPLGDGFEHVLSQPDRDALSAEAQRLGVPLSEVATDAPFEAADPNVQPLDQIYYPAPADDFSAQAAQAEEANPDDFTTQAQQISPPDHSGVWRDYSAFPDETAVVEDFDPYHDILELPAHPMLAEYVQSGYLLTFEDGQNLLLAGLKESEPTPVWEVRPTEADGAQPIAQ